MAAISVGQLIEPAFPAVGAAGLKRRRASQFEGRRWQLDTLRGWDGRAIEALCILGSLNSKKPSSNMTAVIGLDEAQIMKATLK